MYHEYILSYKKIFTLLTNTILEEKIDLVYILNICVCFVNKFDFVFFFFVSRNLCINVMKKYFDLVEWWSFCFSYFSLFMLSWGLLWNEIFIYSQIYIYLKRKNSIRLMEHKIYNNRINGAFWKLSWIFKMLNFRDQTINQALLSIHIYRMTKKNYLKNIIKLSFFTLLKLKSFIPSIPIYYIFTNREFL